MEKILKIEKLKTKNCNDVKKIYMDSFNKEDRFSWFNLMLNVILRKTNIYTLSSENNLVAFIYIISYKSKNFILYLAVDKRYRNKGFGTYLLNWYLNNNKDKEILLNIDDVNEKFDDNIIRQKRLNFYLKNGFYLTDYLSVSKDLKANILSTKEEFNIEEYKQLDKIISKLFFCKNDKIEKRTKNN